MNQLNLFFRLFVVLLGVSFADAALAVKRNTVQTNDNGFEHRVVSPHIYFATSDIQIRKLKSLIVSSQADIDKVYEKLQKATKELRSRR